MESLSDKITFTSDLATSYGSDILNEVPLLFKRDVLSLACRSIRANIRGEYDSLIFTVALRLGSLLYHNNKIRIAYPPFNKNRAIYRCGTWMPANLLYLEPCPPNLPYLPYREIKELKAKINEVARRILNKFETEYNQIIYLESIGLSLPTDGTESIVYFHGAFTLEH